VSENASLRSLHSFPTRRSSDLRPPDGRARAPATRCLPAARSGRRPAPAAAPPSAAAAGAPVSRARGSCRLSDRQLGEQARGLLRSEEHTSELQSLAYLVCRLLL